MIPIQLFLWSALRFELLCDTPKAKGVMGCNELEYSQSSD